MEDQTYSSKLEQIHHVVSMVGTVITPEEAIDIIRGYFLELEYWRRSSSVVILLPTHEQAFTMYNKLLKTFMPQYLNQRIAAPEEEKHLYAWNIFEHPGSFTFVGRSKTPEDDIEIDWNEHIPFKTKEELDEAFRANGWPDVDFESE